MAALKHVIAWVIMILSTGAALAAQSYPAKPVRVIFPFAPGISLNTQLRLAET
jgi:tripartite-type tricarboxylate transporter receptor subunit TctC